MTNTHTTADTRLELLDGEGRWVPMEFPAFEGYTFEAIYERAQLYVERGAAKSVRVQRRRYEQWVTVKTLTVMIVETDHSELTYRGSFCECGHLHAVHAVGGGLCYQQRCACLEFELKEV